MKPKIYLMIGLFAPALLSFGQRPSLNLTFTAIDITDHVEIESIRVINLTQAGDTVLLKPDTVMSLSYMGMPEMMRQPEDFRVFRNYPNPVADQTTITIFVPHEGLVSMIITDIQGRLVLRTDQFLDAGHHSFLFTPGSGSMFFFSALWNGRMSSIKILQSSTGIVRTSSFEWIGSEIKIPHPKASGSIQSFTFSPGDTLLYIGYSGGLQSGIIDHPMTNKTYVFQFATKIPCPGMPTVTYEGQVYNTIQVFSQCWMKENLNAGTMIPGSQSMSDNGLIEKYCYGDDPANCLKYQGLYQWDEMMQYTTERGVRGICPPGWHIPDDEEWKLLEGAVDSQYGIGDPEWNKWDYRGYDAGTNLKTAIGWNEGGNGSDQYGFSGLPGGYLYSPGSFTGAGYYGIWWVSEGGSGIAWDRQLDFINPEIVRYWFDTEAGFSVRCLRDL